MNEDLFKKYSIQIDKQKKNKQEIIKDIEELSGISLNENDFSVQNKKITFTVSSVLRSKLQNKKITEFLQRKGFTVVSI